MITEIPLSINYSRICVIGS